MLFIFFLVEFMICVIFVDNFCDNVCFCLYKLLNKVVKCMFFKLMICSVKVWCLCYDVLMKVVCYYVMLEIMFIKFDI